MSKVFDPEQLRKAGENLPLELPTRELIEKANALEDPMERTRMLYQLSLRYRELAHETLEAAKEAANAANATGITLTEVAKHAGSTSVTSLTRRPTAPPSHVLRRKGG